VADIFFSFFSGGLLSSVCGDGVLYRSTITPKKSANDGSSNNNNADNNDGARARFKMLNSHNSPKKPKKS
jgi:hypothetical protein